MEDFDKASERLFKMKFMAYVIDIGRAFMANICLALQFRDDKHDTSLKKFTQSM